MSRTLPKIRLHSGVNFDRSTALIGDGFTQTLEPQVQYLYIPYEDQSTIGLYDTTQLQDDYNGLFRDTRYSGLDRIAEVYVRQFCIKASQKVSALSQIYLIYIILHDIMTA